MFVFQSCKSVPDCMSMEERRVIKTKLFVLFLVLLYASIPCTIAADTVSANQTITYNMTIVSPQETFELGFFRPGKSMNHYVGIWYKKMPNRTVVWVANRDAPLTDTLGELTLTLQGVLILRNATMGNVIWSSANSSTKSVRNPVGQLLDTGNFVIYEEGDDINQENHIWQSFDFLTDTLLPGMKLGWDLVTGIDIRLNSWKSDDDPASSEFSLSIDTKGYPQLLQREGKVIKFRGGPWNGLRFTGITNMIPNPFYSFKFVLNQREAYYQHNLVDTSVLMRLVLHPGGHAERLLWTHSKPEWSLYTALMHRNVNQVPIPVSETFRGPKRVRVRAETFPSRFFDRFDKSTSFLQTFPSLGTVSVTFPEVQGRF